jgi:hypothetical protein
MKVGGYFSMGKNKGEYAFTMMGMGTSGMDGSTVIFAFGVD